MSIINVQASDVSQEQISRKFMESDQKAKDARESAEVNFCLGWDREGQLDEIANEAEEIARLWKAELDASCKLPINSALSETEIIHLKEVIQFIIFDKVMNGSGEMYVDEWYNIIDDVVDAIQILDRRFLTLAVDEAEKKYNKAVAMERDYYWDDTERTLELASSRAREEHFICCAMLNAYSQIRRPQVSLQRT